MDNFKTFQEHINEEEMTSRLTEMVEESLNEDCLFEMANISKKKTKLPVIVWVQTKIITRHESPRIKFLNSTADKTQKNLLVPLSISNDPKILSRNTRLNISSAQFEEVRQWVIRNRDLLMQLWNDDITSDEFIDQMK